MNRQDIYASYFNGKQEPKPYKIEGFKSNYTPINNLGHPEIVINNIDDLRHEIYGALALYEHDQGHSLANSRITFVGVNQRDTLPDEKTSCRAFVRGIRDYIIYINTNNHNSPTLLDISEAGGRAILGHELMHLYTYNDRSKLDLSKLSYSYLSLLIRKKLQLTEHSRAVPTIADYEKHIDHEVIGLGQAAGLQEYQDYLYPLLSEREQMKRQYFYYTNAEIQKLVQQ